MKVLVLGILALGLSFSNVFAAEAYKPAGWFVIDKQEDISEGGSGGSSYADIAEPEVEDTFVKPEERKTDGAVKASFEEERFASNGKDLMIAFLWMKKEIAANKNFVVSPWGAYMSAVVLANGVIDETLSEFSRIFSVLHLSRINRRLLEYGEKKKNSISVYNSLWGTSFSTRYQQVIAKMLNTEVWGISDDVSQLNNWLEVRTNGEGAAVTAAETVGTGDIFAVNAGYFDAGVLPFFETYYKRQQAFHAGDGKVFNIETMWQTGKADYFEDDVMQAVRLFYKNGDFLTLFKPKQGYDLREFAAMLNARKLDFAYLPGMRRNVNMEIFMPEFAVLHNASDTKKVFGMLGIRKIFTLNNDFAKMVSFDEQAKIKSLYLQAGVKVYGGKEVSGRRPVSDASVVFQIDRPFFFMINNGDFIGALVDGAVIGKPQPAVEVSE